MALRIGGGGSKHVAAALEHDDNAGVSRVALQVIAEMGVDGSTYLEAVLANLDYNIWNVRLNVVYTLAKNGINVLVRWESKVGEAFIL